MEIRKTDTTVADLLDAPNIDKSMLAGKIQKLHIFFSLLIPDMTYEEKQLLDDALINIEYMYDFLAIKQEKAYIIIRVENNAKTVELLEKNGFRCIKDSDIVF